MPLLPISPSSARRPSERASPGRVYGAAGDRADGEQLALVVVVAVDDAHP